MLPDTSTLPRNHLLPLRFSLETSECYKWADPSNIRHSVDVILDERLYGNSESLVLVWFHSVWEEALNTANIPIGISEILYCQRSNNVTMTNVNFIFQETKFVNWRCVVYLLHGGWNLLELARISASSCQLALFNLLSLSTTLSFLSAIQYSVTSI